VATCWYRVVASVLLSSTFCAPDAGRIGLITVPRQTSVARAVFVPGAREVQLATVAVCDQLLSERAGEVVSNPPFWSATMLLQLSVTGSAEATVAVMLADAAQYA